MKPSPRPEAELVETSEFGCIIRTHLRGDEPIRVQFFVDYMSSRIEALEARIEQLEGRKKRLKKKAT